MIDALIVLADTLDSAGHKTAADVVDDIVLAARLEDFDDLTKLWGGKVNLRDGGEEDMPGKRFIEVGDDDLPAPSDEDVSPEEEARLQRNMGGSEGVPLSSVEHPEDLKSYRKDELKRRHELMKLKKMFDEMEAEEGDEGDKVEVELEGTNPEVISFEDEPTDITNPNARYKPYMSDEYIKEDDEAQKEIDEEDEDLDMNNADDKARRGKQNASKKSVKPGSVWYIGDEDLKNTRYLVFAKVLSVGGMDNWAPVECEIVDYTGNVLKGGIEKGIDHTTLRKFLLDWHHFADPGHPIPSREKAKIMNDEAQKEIDDEQEKMALDEDDEFEPDANNADDEDDNEDIVAEIEMKLKNAPELVKKLIQMLKAKPEILD